LSWAASADTFPARAGSARGIGMEAEYGTGDNRYTHCPP
jgi:hypothetical protein